MRNRRTSRSETRLSWRTTTGRCAASSSPENWRALVVQLPVLQELTANTGKISFVYVKVDQPQNVRGVLNQFKEKLPDLSDL